MGKIKNWSRHREYDERDYPFVWKHDEEELLVVVQSHYGVLEKEYTVYARGLNSTFSSSIWETKKKETARKEAVRWMRENPQPPEEYYEAD